MKSDTWERHETDVMMAYMYMAAPLLGIFPNDISLIVDMKSNIPRVARLDF